MLDPAEYPPGSAPFPAGSAHPAFLASQPGQPQLSPSAATAAAAPPLLGAGAFVPTAGAVPGAAVSAATHRLHRHRPLGRTHSAPLPLGVFHQQQNLILQQQQHEQYLKDQKLYVKQVGWCYEAENVGSRPAIPSDLKEKKIVKLRSLKSKFRFFFAWSLLEIAKPKCFF